jgi:uncharacterized protein
MAAVQPSYEDHVLTFLGSGVDRPTLGLVYGRRRIGKSTLLERVTRERAGFYWEATRADSAVHLARLGEALGAHLGVGSLNLATWEDAFGRLLRLGAGGAVPVVVDEFGYVVEADRSADSVVASALGPASRRRSGGQARLILCGSALAMMQSLTSGQAPLRGRSGMELVMHPAGFRQAALWLGKRANLTLATRVYAVIGGVIGYATDMVEFDLPDRPADFDGWVTRRVLSPAATLHHEAATLLSEDPTLSAGSPVIYHSILGAIANGSVTAGKIASRLRRSVPNIDPALKRLVSAGFVCRHEDPSRSQRPVYALGDPFLQFHYAILEPHGTLFRDRAPAAVWSQRLAHVFDARVRGPVFEEQTRQWVRRHADESTIGGPPDHVGPSLISVDGKERQIDVLVAVTGNHETPAAERRITAIGEAKAGEIVDVRQLQALEQARFALGQRALRARLLLFAPGFTKALITEAGRRDDVELIDLDRLYHGA